MADGGMVPHVLGPKAKKIVGPPADAEEAQEYLPKYIYDLLGRVNKVDRGKEFLLSWAEWLLDMHMYHFGPPEFYMSRDIVLAASECESVFIVKVLLQSVNFSSEFWRFRATMLGWYEYYDNVAVIIDVLTKNGVFCVQTINIAPGGKHQRPNPLTQSLLGVAVLRDDIRLAERLLDFSADPYGVRLPSGAFSDPVGHAQSWRMSDLVRSYCVGGERRRTTTV